MQCSKRPRSEISRVPVKALGVSVRQTKHIRNGSLHKPTQIAVERARSLMISTCSVLQLLCRCLGSLSMNANCRVTGTKDLQSWHFSISSRNQSSRLITLNLFFLARYIYNNIGRAVEQSKTEYEERDKQVKEKTTQES